MPEHLRSLIVILILSFITFAYARTIIPEFITDSDFRNRRNTWFFLTVVAFICSSFWIYTVILLIFLFSKMRTEKNTVALYFFLLLMLPTGEAVIPGFGIVNFLFAISHQRLLVLALLLPAAMMISSKKHDFAFGKLMSDKFLLMYLAYSSFLYMRDTSATDMLRQTFYNFTDIFLPYYVISRYIKNMAQFRDAAMSFLIAILLIAIVAIFEYLRSWLLYSALPSAMGLIDMTAYLGRAGSVRAVATAGQSIALGFAMVVGIGLFVYVQPFIVKKSSRKWGLGMLVSGAYAGLSRGPWMGAMFLWVCFIITGRKAAQKLMMLTVGGTLSLVVLSVLPGGEKIVNLIPYIGNTEKANITYREDLFTNSMIVIKRQFWTGSPNFMQTPEMEEMRNGFGVIDIVNSYLRVTLESGFIGLFLFAGFFLLLLYSLLKSIKRIADKSSEEHLLGRALFATLCGILLTIVTTSSITVIPIMYWAFAGLVAAYLNIVREQSLASVSFHSGSHT